MRWLLDEMLPPETCWHLNLLGHDAISVLRVGLRKTADERILDFAIREQRVLATENHGDFARILQQRLTDGQACVPVAFVRRTKLPGGRALPYHLARLLDDWAVHSPNPGVGPHWL